MKLDIEYRLPTLKDEQILQEYIDEHYKNGETHISASIGLTTMSFSDWIKKVNRMATIGEEHWGRSNLYLVFIHDQLIGLMNVRYEMEKSYRDIYGNIGYGVRPAARRNGFATEMLKYGLKECEQHGLQYAILGCIEENIASARTMIRNGGQLIRKGNGYKPDKINLYYKFTLQKSESEPEYWDLYTKDKIKTDKTHLRGVWPIPEGYYHLIVHGWIRNAKGEYLISQRAATRPSFPLKWECVGGSVLAGEDGLSAVVREIKEEVGLDVRPEDGELVSCSIREKFGDLVCQDIVEDYLFIYDGEVDLNNSTTDEVTQIKWASVKEIYEMIERKEFANILKQCFEEVNKI